MTDARTIRSTHPTYDTLKPHWEFYLASYEGGPDYVSPRHLFSHVRETPADYADRLRRAYYLNYCRAVVDTYVSHLARKPVARRASHPAYDAFAANCDGAGASLDRFVFERLAPMTQVFGTMYVLVDMPRPDAPPLSRDDEARSGLRPFVVPVFPHDVTHWALDDTGAFRWVRIRETHTPEAGPLDPPIKPVTRYRTWTPEWWALHNEAGEPIAGGPDDGRHDLGEVPLVRCLHLPSRTRPGMGVSALADIAPVNREIFNLSSLLQEFLARQCFNFLVLDEDLLSDEGRRRLGTSNALPGREGAVLPHYVSPPVDPAAFLQKEREAAIREIYRLALLPPGEAEAKAPASGVARAWDFHDARGALGRMAANLEACERRIARLVGRWLGVDIAVDIDYPRDFSVTDLADEMTRAIQAVGLGLGPTFDGEIKKRLHRKLLPGSARAEAMDREIDGAR